MKQGTREEIKDLKKAILFLYESIKVGGFHPDLKEIIGKFEEDVFEGKTEASAQWEVEKI